MIKKWSLLWLCVFFTSSRIAGAADSAGLDVFVSILPQAYFVERVGGDRVEVDVLVGPGLAPETFEPTPRQITRLWSADVFFRIGIPFEEGVVEKIADAHKKLTIVDTRQGVPLRYFEHSHHHGHAHRHTNADPHIWLSPQNVKIQAATICETLCRLAPHNREEFEKNLAEFHDDLEKTHQHIQEMLAPYKGKPFYVFHPAFGYLGDAYGLEQVAVETEGHEPSPRQLVRLVERAQSDSITTIFVQPQRKEHHAAALAREIGGDVVRLDPLAGDYLSNLHDMAKAIRDSFERH